jgi:hypothetical protein
MKMQKATPRQTANVQQLDVAQSRETLAELVNRLRESAQSVELVEGGRVVARIVLVEDDKKLKEVPLAEQHAAWRRLRKFQRKAAKAMDKHGVTEEDLIREILKDD